MNGPVDSDVTVGTPSELEALKVPLASHGEAERLGAIEALGKIRSPDSLSILAGHLEGPESWSVTDAVMRALAQAGPANRSVLSRLLDRSESLDARARLTQVIDALDSGYQAQKAAPGWYPDPAGQFQFRFWDGLAWTAHVAQDGQQSLAPAEAPAVPSARARHKPKKPACRLVPAAWGARSSLLGLLVALLPGLALNVATLLLVSHKVSSGPSNATAVFALVSTALFDGWWIVSAWFFSLRKFGVRLETWGFRRPTLSALWLVPLVLAAAFLVEGIWVGLVHVPQEAVVRQFPHTAIGLLAFTICSCVIAPLCEEVFFRGFLFQGFSSWRGPLVAAVISSALWSAGHRELALFPPLLVVGLLLCWAFRRSGSIWTTIVIHVAWNAIGLIVWIH